MPAVKTFSRAIVEFDRTAEMFRNIDEMNNLFVEVGFPERGTVKRGTRKGSGHKPYADMAEVRKIAVIQEYGTEHIPPRPFLAPSYDENRTELNIVKAQEFIKVTEGKSKAEASIKRIGAFMVKKTKEQIMKTNTPPLAPSTVRRKGSDKPLIDTKSMYNSVQSVVVKL